MSIVGTPAPLLMPAKNYTFESVTELIEIVVPKKGSYPEGFSIQGEFDLLPEKGVILFGTLVQVLFAFKQYPALESNERFVISGLETEAADPNLLVIVGRVVRVLEE